MDRPLIAAAAIAIVLLAAALLVVWSRRDIPRVRGMSVILSMVIAAIPAAALLWSMGYGVPLIGGVAALPGDSQVLSTRLIEGQGIYLTVDLPGEPRLFWLPWDVKLAEKLQEMMNNPDNAGVVVTIPPFEWSWDIGPPSFQALPQPKVMPDKPVEPKRAPHFSA